MNYLFDVNLDELLRGKKPSTSKVCCPYSIFFENGSFIRITVGTRECERRINERPETLVGTYNRQAEPLRMYDDLICFLEELRGSLQRA